jgi:hypothetical protein
VNLGTFDNVFCISAVDGFLYFGVSFFVYKYDINTGENLFTLKGILFLFANWQQI